MTVEALAAGVAAPQAQTVDQAESNRVAFAFDQAVREQAQAARTQEAWAPLGDFVSSNLESVFTRHQQRLEWSANLTAGGDAPDFSSVEVKPQGTSEPDYSSLTPEQRALIGALRTSQLSAAESYMIQKCLNEGTSSLQSLLRG